jgi:hypothetical protein
MFNRRTFLEVDLLLNTSESTAITVQRTRGLAVAACLVDPSLITPIVEANVSRPSPVVSAMYMFMHVYVCLYMYTYINIYACVYVFYVYVYICSVCVCLDAYFVDLSLKACIVIHTYRPILSNKCFLWSSFYMITYF